MDHFYGTVWARRAPTPGSSIRRRSPTRRALSFGGWGEWLVVWTVILAVSFSVVRWVGVAAVVVGFGSRLFVAELQADLRAGGRT